LLESKCGFGGSKSNFLNGSFAGSAGVASLCSLPCFTGSIFSDWLNSMDSCSSIVLNVMHEASEAEFLESKCGFGGSKSNFLNGSFAGSAGVASLCSLPCFTGSIFSDWLNSMDSCSSIVLNGMHEASEAEFLERSSSSHTLLDGHHSVLLNSSFAWSILVAPLSTLPGFTGSPFHVLSSNLETWTHLFGSS